MASALDIVRVSGTTPPAPGVRAVPQVVKLIDTSTCIGCKACEVACQEWNDLPPEPTTQDGTYQTLPDTTAHFWNLIKFSEHESPKGFHWLMRKDQCMHCTEPGCLIACPAPGAIVQYANGIVDFEQEACIGCGYCITGCPFNVPRISQEDSKAYKCSLCSDRVAVGQAPACAKVCPTGAIQFGSKEQMKDYAAKRVVDLKSRGYDKAGLYDPQGVGGTHVMYVLHHADRPELYKSLPSNPGISPLVSLWKGIAKPVATVAMAAVALGSLFHYVMKGPNEVSKELEDELEKEDAK